jgi:DNA-binding NtrC family response regulator
VVTPRPPRVGTLLVIDDDPTLRTLLRRAFSDDGYRVLTAISVAEGLAMLRTFRVDLVLTDAFRTPGETDPWTNLARLRDRARGTPVVICSAHRERSFAGYAQRGFAGLVAKPIGLDALSAVVRQTIDRDRAAHPWRSSAWEVARRQ